jgi:WD40 repeat protein
MSDVRNPFVGPRPLTDDDPLFGREQELEDIKYLLIADRILLLYSVSGAGKTSLIQAGLVGRMEEEGYQVLPLLRVYPPAGEVPEGTAKNPYLGTVLGRLVQSDPAREAIRSSPETSSSAAISTDLGDNLGGYLESAPWIVADSRPKLLIFDQFEEILTHDPEDIERKREFFSQLGRALKDKNLWAIFAIREEFLGSLDPYLHHLPTRLATRYRLELLPRNRAAKTITDIAKSGGVAFDQDSAQRLTENLASYRSRGAFGRKRRRLPYVEPLHLQIVCRELWIVQIKRDGAETIRIKKGDDLAGNVDRALARYFAGAMTRTSELEEVREEQVDEKRIRLWVHRELFTEDNVRRQIRIQTETEDGKPKRTAAGLATVVVSALVEERLLRVDERGGITWIELTHDRLVEPVKKNNDEWFRRNLVPFQWYALNWDREEEYLKSKWLLTGKELSLAREWIDKNEYDIDDPIERRFLDACKEVDEREQNQRKVEERNRRIKSRWIQAIVLISLVALCGTLFLYFSLLHTKQDLEARERELERALKDRNDLLEKQKQVTQNLAKSLAQENTLKGKLLRQKSSFLVQALNSQSTREKWIYQNHEIAALLAIQGLRFNADLDEEEKALNESLITESLLMALNGQNPGNDFSHQVRNAATAGDSSPPLLCSLGLGIPENNDLLFRPFDRRKQGYSFPDLEGDVLALSNDCRRLLSTDAKGIRLYRQDDGPVELADVSARGPFAFVASAVAGVGIDGIVRIWKESADQRWQTIELTEGERAPSALALNENAKLLAIGAEGGKVSLYGLSWTTPAQPRNRCKIDLFSREQGTPQRLKELRSHIIGVHLIDQDSRPLLLIAQAGGDLTAYSVKSESCSQLSSRQIDLKQESNLLARVERRRLLTSTVDDGGTRLAIGGTEGFVATLRLQRNELQPGVVRLKGQLGDVVELRFMPDGGHLAAADALGEVRVWDMEGLNDISMRKIEAPEKSGNRPDQVTAIAVDQGSGNGRIYVAKRRSGVARGTLEPQKGQVDRLTLQPLDSRRGARALESFSFNGHSYVAIPGGSTVTLWTAGETGELATQVDAGGDVRALAVHVENGSFATGTEQGLIRVWTMKSTPEGIELAADPVEFAHPSAAPVRALTFHPQERRLAAGYRSDDPSENLLVWDLSDKHAPAMSLTGHNRPVQALRFQQTAPFRLASGGEDSRIHLWRLTLEKSIQPAATLIGHVGSVNALAFSADKPKVLASAGNDGTIRLWDFATSLDEDRLHPYPIIFGGARSELLSLAFLSGDDLLAAGDSQGNLYLWRTNRESLINAACAALWRNLSQDEWSRFIGRAQYEQTCQNLPRGDGTHGLQGQRGHCRSRAMSAATIRASRETRRTLRASPRRPFVSQPSRPAATSVSASAMRRAVSPSAAPTR